MNYLQSLEQIENSNESFIVKNYAKYLKNQLYLAQHLGKINENVLENVSDLLEGKRYEIKALPISTTYYMPTSTYGKKSLLLTNPFELTLNQPKTKIEINLFKNLTHELCDEKKNKKAKELNDLIRNNLKLPNFNLINYYKFNPSILPFGNKYLMTYRTYITSEIDCLKFEVNECHYWNTIWQPNQTVENDKQFKNNILGLAILSDNFELISDTFIMGLDDGYYGIEDVRLYIDKYGDYNIHGSMKRKHNDGKKDIVYVRQATGKLGNMKDIENNFNELKVIISINCLDLHENQNEKNWFGYIANGKNYICSPSYPNFFPIKTFENDDLSGTQDKQYLNERKKILSQGSIEKEKLAEQFLWDKITKCLKNKEITDINFSDKLYKIYKIYLENDNKPLFRFSGGSFGYILPNNNQMFIGHVVINKKLLNQMKIKNIRNKNIKNNLDKILKNRRKELITNIGILQYYMFFYELDVQQNKIIKISHCFNIFESAEENTEVNFPCGLIYEKDNIIISYGESDAKCIIVKLNTKNINENLMITNLENYDYNNYKIFTFDKNGNEII